MTAAPNWGGCHLYFSVERKPFRCYNELNNGKDGLKDDGY